MADQVSKRSVIYEILLDVEAGKKSAKDATTEVEKFSNALGEAAETSQRLTSRLRDLKDQIGKQDFGSKKFTELSIEAAKLQDQIDKVNQRVRNLASNTRHIDALIAAVQGLAGGFAVVQGASALFGKENENLQKALLKIQASIAILNGLQQVQQTLMTENAAKTALYSAALKVNTFITNAATVAAQAFRAVMVSLGIGAVIAGIALLVKYWDEIKTAIGLAEKSASDFNKSEQKRLKFLIDKYKILGKSTREYELALISLQIREAELANDEEKVVDLLNEKKLKQLEFEKEKGIEQLEFEKERLERQIYLAEENSIEQLELKQKLVDVERAIETASEKYTQEDIYQILKVADKKKLQLQKEFYDQQEKLRKEAFEKRKQDDQLIQVPGISTQGVPDALRTEMQKLTDQIYFLQKAWDDLNGTQSKWVELTDGTMIKGTIPEVKGGLKDIVATADELGQKQLQLAEITTGIFLDMLQMQVGNSKAQLAFGISEIITNQAIAISKAISSAKGLTGIDYAIQIASAVAAATAAFGQIQGLLSQAKSAQANAVSQANAFFEGTEYLERGNNPKGKDTIPIWANEGEAIIPTDKNAMYPGVAKAMIDGNLDEFIASRWINPSLAVKAVEHARDDSRVIDYSEKFYRQLLAVNEGNHINKRAVSLLSSIDRKIGGNFPKTYGRD